MKRVNVLGPPYQDRGAYRGPISSPALLGEVMLGTHPHFQTFFYVILPNLGTAILAGGMLAFALSFDEVIVF